MCVCSTNLGFSGERIMYQIRMYHTLWYQDVCGVVISYQDISYVPGISRQKSIRTYVVVRMIPTFLPWTHTSDDSYIYQLSLVVATATTVVSFYFFICFFVHLVFLSVNASGLLAFVYRNCRAQCDGTSFHCLLCLLHSYVVSRCRAFVTTELVSL